MTDVLLDGYNVEISDGSIVSNKIRCARRFNSHICAMNAPSRATIFAKALFLLTVNAGRPDSCPAHR
jgi:hypothetical protein